MDECTVSQYKAYANNLVGIWFNEVQGEVLVFAFLFDYTQQSDLLILDKGSRVDASYSIHNMEDGDWFLVIWNEEDNKTMFYHIEFLSPDILIITCNSKMEVKVFERKI